MSLAVLYGASSGALHAVTGPDHVLSLGPVVLERPSRSFRIGFSWGIGHSMGTLLLAVPLLLCSRFVQLQTLAGISDRVAGLALLAMASWSLWHSRRHAMNGSADARNPFWVGTIHGATGAGGLLMVVPMLLRSQLTQGLAFLLAFSAGSSFAMACLTACIGKLGTKLGHKVLSRAQTLLATAAMAVGAAWLVGL